MIGGGQRPAGAAARGAFSLAALAISGATIDGLVLAKVARKSVRFWMQLFNLMMGDTCRFGMARPRVGAAASARPPLAG